jgi:hypothetical protein
MLKMMEYAEAIISFHFTYEIKQDIGEGGEVVPVKVKKVKLSLCFN